ncbi:hypothetical protein VNO77_19465 [Canavalia gladiata]|uniref:Uncharacterized protein n=1 Tax=Canavalia gladiata TaxID=3824 RepID=A0AAN9LMP7_CANGL
MQTKYAFVEIVKGRIDKRDYGRVVLRNFLQVFLISNPDTDKVLDGNLTTENVMSTTLAFVCGKFIAVIGLIQI